MNLLIINISILTQGISISPFNTFNKYYSLLFIPHIRIDTFYLRAQLIWAVNVKVYRQPWGTVSKLEILFDDCRILL
jgi:hypothetical protein